MCNCMYVFYHSFVDFLYIKIFRRFRYCKEGSVDALLFHSKDDHSAYSDLFTSLIADNRSVLAGCDRGEFCIFLIYCGIN